MNQLDGCCSISDLCDAHRDDQYKHLRGVGEARGHQWALDLIAAGMSPDALPWPETSDKVQRLAVGRVADLTRDERLRELLAKDVIKAARRRWGGA